MFSKYYQDQFINIYEEVLKPEKIVSHFILLKLSKTFFLAKSTVIMFFKVNLTSKS